MMNKRPRIAIIGANGQVGTELCLYLDLMGICEPIAIARSEYGTILLWRLGIQCRHGDLSRTEGAERLIADCDAILESMPKQPDIRHGTTGAFYQPKEDYVSMPELDRFDSAEHYYSLSRIESL